MTSDKNWKPCPSGAIQDVATDQQRLQLRQTFTRRAAVGAMLMAGTGLAVAVSNALRSPQQILACSDVKELAQQYVQGTLAEDTSTRVTAHLNKCPKCESYIQGLRKNAAV